MEGINLFMAGDRLQSIYNPKDVSWRDLGIDMRGRSALLKKSYRTGGKHINLALDFLMLEQSLKGEVEKFYEGRDDIENENMSNKDIYFVEGDYKKVAERIEYFIKVLGYNPEDILVLCKSNNRCNSLLDSLNSEIKRNAEVTKEPREGHITITTYHSSKGLEAPICVLVDMDSYLASNIKEQEINQRKLAYVGATRASEILYIHAKSFSKTSYARDLKDIVQKDLSDIDFTKK